LRNFSKFFISKILREHLLEYNMPICISIADDEAISELGSNFSDDTTLTKKSSRTISSKKSSKSSNASKSKSSNSYEDSEDDDVIIDVKDFSSNEASRYKILDKYFKKIDTMKKNMMVDIINKKSDISLRILDKFVTKYCSKVNISYKLEKDSEHEFNVHISYKAQLKSYRKRFFDPFRRGKKFYYNYDKEDNTKTTLTTLGQLNFFKWAFSNKIIDYVINHKSNIVKNISKWDKDSIKLVKEQKDKIRTRSNKLIKSNNVTNNNITSKNKTSNNSVKPNKSKVTSEKNIKTSKIVLSFD